MLNDDKQNEPTQKQVPHVKESETDKTSKFCTLNHLKDGMLGKLQILKSGKARIVLGDNNLLVDVGSTTSFRQVKMNIKLNLKKKKNT